MEKERRLLYRIALQDLLEKAFLGTHVALQDCFYLPKKLAVCVFIYLFIVPTLLYYTRGAHCSCSLLVSLLIN